MIAIDLIGNYRFSRCGVPPSVAAVTATVTAVTTVTAGAPARSLSRPLRIGVALAIVYVVWGSTYLAIRVMVDEMPPFVGSGARFLAAGVLLGGALVVRGGPGRLAVTRRQLLGCVLIALLLPVLGQGMVTLAEDGGAPSGLTALLIAAVPLWVICYRAGSGERPAARTVAGVVVGFGGLGVLVSANGLGGDVPLWPMVLILLAGLSWAFGSWYQPRIALPRDPLVVAVHEMLVGGALLTIVGVACGERVDPLAYLARSWAAWAYLVLFGSVLAFSAYIWLLQSTATSVVATYAYVNPLVAVGLGWLILSEPVTLPTLVAGVIIVFAVAVVVRSELRR